MMLCPECQGRAYVIVEDSEDEKATAPTAKCPSCDGLGVVPSKEKNE